MQTERKIRYHYEDPIELVWTQIARALNMTVQRSPHVFATWDGKSTLTIGTPETLDADDHLAQMILHEICHWLVSGPESFADEDWGLVFGEPEHEAFERATLRLQCYFADHFQLRNFLASTTDYRGFYDELGDDPLGFQSSQEAQHSDSSIEMARQGLQFAVQSGVANLIMDGIRRTDSIRQIVRDMASDSSLWQT